MRHHLRSIAFVVGAILTLCPNQAQAQLNEPVDGCGFGAGLMRFKPMNIQPGGGGDTVLLPDKATITFLHIYDSASPVTLESHDRLIFTSVNPAMIVLRRMDDNLAVCVLQIPYQIQIDAHYCRSKDMSDRDTNNHEIEEFRFVSAGEIWLSDALMEAYHKNPAALKADNAQDNDGAVPPAAWSVRAFSEVMPDYAKPATNCP